MKNLKQEIKEILDRKIAMLDNNAEVADQILELVGKAIESCIPEERGTQNYTSSSEAIIYSKHDFGFNSAIDEMRNKLKEFMGETVSEQIDRQFGRAIKKLGE